MYLGRVRSTLLVVTDQDAVKLADKSIMRQLEGTIDLCSRATAKQVLVPLYRLDLSHDEAKTTTTTANGVFGVLCVWTFSSLLQANALIFKRLKTEHV